MLRDRQHILYVLAFIFYTYAYVSILYHEVWPTKKKSECTDFFIESDRGNGTAGIGMDEFG